MNQRIVIVGGPSRGKSTLAHELWEQSFCQVPVFCGDPASTVVYQKGYTTYLPEGLEFAGDNGAAAWVAANWFTMPGPWVCEGHVMARALRRWGAAHYMGRDYTRTGDGMPCDRIIVLDKPAHRPTTSGQEAMHKGVMKVWSEIAHHFEAITEVRT
jgi:hypothetical protein